eukprot:TRINITY_DN1186_c0_g1_i3.p1 TRINITY_DN1186_c0_g1~~TRINITY_DN1186_c0_g1_i3.p1  ORF type:complete len:400 (-),score=54.45 TRINITY_DN1186_c0_g1_i3:173-1372(-)
MKNTYTFLFLLLSMLLPFSSGTGCVNEDVLPQQSTTHAGWTLTWFIDCSQQTFNFTLSVKTNGWVGFGIGTHKHMFPSDIIIGFVDDQSNEAFVFDRWSSQYDTPDDDTSLGGFDNILTFSGSQSNGVTTLNITRPLSTNDSWDLPIENKDTIILYSYNTDTDNFDFEHTTKGVVTINLFTGASSSSFNKRLFHGPVMLIAWGLLVVQGNYIARFLKGLGHLWFQLHVSIQVLVLALTIAAFIVIENYLGPSSSDHFSGVHHFFGLFIVFLAILQGFGGWLADRMYNPQRTSVPLFPDKLHIWNGKFLSIFSFATIFLGFNEIGVNNTPYIVFAIWVFVVFAFWIGMSIWEKNRQNAEVNEASSKAHSNKVPLYALFAQIFIGLVLVGTVVGEVWYQVD